MCDKSQTLMSWYLINFIAAKNNLPSKPLKSRVDDDDIISNRDIN